MEADCCHIIRLEKSLTETVSSADEAATMLSADFFKELIDVAAAKEDIREAKKAQKFETGIESISKVIELGGD